jgi:hypothetical protein
MEGLPLLFSGESGQIALYAGSHNFEILVLVLIELISEIMRGIDLVVRIVVERVSGR